MTGRSLADVFNRLGYMERKGSGFGKILNGYKVPPWVVYFCRCGKPAGGIYSSDFNIIKQEKKELNASFCPPKQKSRRQGHGGQPAAWNKGTRTLALAVT